MERREREGGVKKRRKGLSLQIITVCRAVKIREQQQQHPCSALGCWHQARTPHPASFHSTNPSFPPTWHPLWAAQSVFQAPRVFQACCVPAWPPGPAAGSHSGAGHGIGSRGRGGVEVLPRRGPGAISRRALAAAERDGREGTSHMTAKMQREDAVSGFSFLFPAPLFTSQGWVCPRGQPRELGLDLGLELRNPRPPGRQVEITAPAQLKIPLGVASPSCRGVRPRWV